MRDGNIPRLQEQLQHLRWLGSKKPIILAYYDTELAFRMYVKQAGLADDNVIVKFCTVEYLPHKNEFHYFFSHKK